MPRTRDYTLMLSAIALLVATIGGILALGISSPFSQGAAVFVSTGESEPTYSAEISTPETVSKEIRLKELREKISKMSDQVIAAVAPLESASEETPVVPEVTEGVAAVEQRCGSYHRGGAGWDAAGLRIEEAEGARLVFRERTGVSVASSTEPVFTRDVVLQLPLRSLPSLAQTCVASDVIGIATDGSLIRNDEVGVYKIFGGSTLVGYALDGFPIYGSDSSKTDICGGRVVAGQYRYQLAPNRETVINCYAGTPVAI